jgi:hypothetical protein
MAKVIIKVIVGLVVLAYAAAFLSWNAGSQEITALQLGATKFSQQMPLGGLVFIGLIAGAVIMAVAAWSAWSTQKSRADKAVAQVQKAKEKLQAQLATINELRVEVDRLQSEVEGLKAGDGTWGRSNHDDRPAGEKAAAGEAVPDEDEII